MKILYILKEAEAKDKYSFLRGDEIDCIQVGRDF